MPDTDIEIPRRGTFIRKLWALTWPYFWSEEKWAARGLLLVVIVMSLALVFINVLLNYWNRDFFNSLQNKDVTAFWHLLGKFCILAGAYIVIAVYYLYLRQMLQIRWRKWMTDQLLRRWLSDQSYYRLQFTKGRTDNPEQRIEADIALFTNSTLALSLDLLNSVVTLVSFVAILWVVSGPLAFVLAGHHIVIPGYMVWVAIIYAIVGSWLTYVVGRPLIRINFMQERFNASFRFGMSRLRENSESVAFYGGEETERKQLTRSFEKIWNNWWRLMRRQKRLTWLTATYGQLAGIFPLLVAAPRYFAGAIELGGLTQIADAFGQVQGALSWFVNSYSDLASWKATVDRLTGFVDAVESAKSLKPEILIEPSQEPELKADGLGVKLQDGRRLIEDMSLRIRPGDKLLISGPSGAGKTTLFRALAGLWPFGAGKVKTPSGVKILFIPQRPYLPVGTLREAIAYPVAAQDYSDADFARVLADVNLPHLAKRMEEEENWSMALSIGEQQRLAIARALLLKPDWLYLDEATAALDGPNEQRMYALLAERLPHATVLSIAHRPEVARYHKQRLEIDPNARTATLSPISTG